VILPSFKDQMKRQGCSFMADAAQRAASNKVSTCSSETGRSAKKRGLQRFRITSWTGWLNSGRGFIYFDTPLH